jgi:hypothetical protein
MDATFPSNCNDMIDRLFATVTLRFGALFNDRQMPWPRVYGRA